MTINPHIVTVLVGVPASGKTTQIGELVRDDQVDTYSHFSLNKLRLEYAVKNEIIPYAPEGVEPDPETYATAYKYCSETDPQGFNSFQKGVWLEMLEKAQKFEVPIYVDNMHLIKRHRRIMIEDIRSYGLTVRGVYTEVSLREALKRNSNSKQLPENVIHEAMSRLEVPDESEFDAFVHVDTEM